MIFSRYLILIIFVLSCITSSYAQTTIVSPPGKSPAKIKQEKEERKAKKKEEKAAKKGNKDKKEKKEKKEKPNKDKAKEPATTSNDSEGGADKNFGPIFDGASVMASAGVNAYMGDIADYTLFPRFSQFGSHTSSAFKFSIARDIKWGLGAQLNYQSGKLIGTRKTGAQSSTVSFENSFFDISFQPRYLISNILFEKNENRRFKIYAQLGIGYMWYRTQLYDSKTLNTRDYEGYIEVGETENLSQKTLSDKTAKATTFTIPYGLTVTYKLNHKIDLYLDITQSNTTTDRLDAFSRDWTAKDKYDYIGIGLVYNFNRTADDSPKKRSKRDEIKTFEDDSANNSSAKGNSANMLSK
ncbi:MAG: hypothetical protein P8Q14_09685, partial [Vicingaceae bacterium]|nr:hypothetical protein [Vicingaceae bacterium]